ncbi:MAG: MMPL family transporter [Rhodospirillaceae bacterium]|nr:MMPL family transporter [Rhodospirillaceae bacterium]
MALIVRLPLAVVAAAVALTAALGWFTIHNVSINTDATDMLSPDLAFRRDFEEYRRAFPVFANNIVIVVEADDPDRAEDGADALFQRLQQDRVRYHQIFYPEGSPFFRRNGLLYLGVKELQALATRLSEAQPLLSTLSRDPNIRGLFEVLGLAVDALGTKDGQPQQLARVLGRIAAVIEAREAEKPRSLSWKELMGTDAAGADDRRRIIVLQPELDFGSVAPAAEALKEIRRHARELGLTPENGVRVRISGSAAIDSEEIGSIADNTSLSGQISFLVVAVLLVLCFRSLRLVAASLLTLIVGIVATAAFAIAAVGSFNLISIAFAVLFIGIGIDYSIHVGLRYREMIERGLAGREAVVAAGRSIGTALGLMAATSALGFFSFLPTDYRGVSELGLIAGFSMIIAFVANVTVLPAILALWPQKARAKVEAAARPPGSLERSEHWLWNHSRAIVLAALAVGLAGLVSLAFARFDRNPLNLKDPSTESVATAIDLLNNPRLRVSTVSILVDSVAEIGPLAEKLKKLPSVDSVRSIYDYVPKDQPAKLDILEEISLQMTPILAPATRAAPPDAEQRMAAITGLRDRIKKALDEKRAGSLAADLKRLHDALDAIAKGGDDFKTAALDQDLVGSLPKRLEALKAALAAQPVDFASLPESLRQRELSPVGKVRIEVVPKDDLRDNAALRRFVSEVQSVAPHATGGPVVELLAGDAVVDAFVLASILAFVLISAGLLLLLRSVLDLLLILAPLLLASAVTVGIAVAVGLSFNFANIIVLPLLIGLGVSSGIHLVIRARRDTAIQLLKTTTPRAVLFSAFTTIASFASLANSSHWGQASMGLLLLIAISVNLVCYLVVLPALLSYVEQRRLGRRVRKGA